MTSSSGGKIFTIPSVEDIRNHELAQNTRGPLLFSKLKEKSNGGIRSRDDGDQVTTTTTTASVEVSMTTSTSVSAVTSTTYCITANPVQKQNPVVRFIRNIPVTFDDIIPDFILGKTTCALFLR